MKGVYYKGKFHQLWGGLYHNTSERFLHGALPDLSRCLKCDDSAAVVVEYESDREHSDDRKLG